MRPDEEIYATLAEIAAEFTPGGEYYFWMKDAPSCLDALADAGLACIGIDGFMKKNGGHMEPLEWIFDGSPEANPSPDWTTFRNMTNARAKAHLGQIASDGAHGCCFMAIDEAEWAEIEP